MATDLTTPSNTLAKCRWHEQYVSEGINKKLNGIIPAGVVRGGRLVASLVNMTVTIQADSDTNDSIYSYIDSNGHQVTFRQAGDVSLDLTAVASTDIFIGLEVTYAVSADTLVKWRAFSLAEILADLTLVILGRVDVPVSGLISASDITPEERREAWMSLSPAMREWRPVITNGSFENCLDTAFVVDGDDWPGWDLSPMVSYVNNVNLSITDTEARTGRHSLKCNLTGSSVQNFSLPWAGFSKVFPGQLFRITVRVKGSSLSGTPSSLLGATLYFYNEDGTSFSSRSASDISLSGTFDWTEISFIGEVPANRWSMGVSVRFADSGGSLTGDIYFDDVQVWLEGGEPTDGYPGSQVDEHSAGNIKAHSVDIARPAYDGNLIDFTNESLRLKQDQSISSVLQLLLGSRDGTSEFLMQLERGGINIDNLISSLGAAKLSSRIDAALPRITVPLLAGGSSYVCLAEFVPATGTQVPVRLYVAESSSYSVTLDAGFFIAVNQEWDGAAVVWKRDIIGEHSTLVMISGGGSSIATPFKVMIRDKGSASPWVDGNAVDDVTIFYEDPGIRIQAEDAVMRFLGQSSYSNLAKNVAPGKNYIYPGLSVCKAWGHITTGLTPSLNDGYNVDFSNCGGVGINYHIDFFTNMDAPPIGAAYAYSVVANMDEGVVPPGVVSTVFLIPYNLLDTGFDIAAYNPGLSIWEDLAAGGGWIITFAVFARMIS